MTKALVALVGVALVAACGSSLSTPGDGGPRGAGGQLGTGGSTGNIARGGSGGASGSGGMRPSGGTGGSLPLCGSDLSGSGGANELGGTNGSDGAADASCAPDPLAGCPKSDAGCGPGAVCAVNSQNGRLDLSTCMPIPPGCESCSCLENALVEFAKQFHSVSLATGTCGCYSGTRGVDGGTQANPFTTIRCSGA
jgi:hypothetical protein